MPLPLFLGIGAAVAGAAGVGSGIHGAVKMKKASDEMKKIQERHNSNLAKFKKKNELATIDMDRLGKLELSILDSFKDFADVFEKIHNRPQFEAYSKDGVNIPQYDGEKIKDVSVGAGVLLGGIGGAAAGTAGGFAAAGATTAAVMAIGTASTGTAIASLSGAAATNATLAAIGGGAIAAGGGGIALGTTILGATTLGVGLLVGGIIFNVTGSKISDKADEAASQVQKAEKQINKICEYLSELGQVADKYRMSLIKVNDIYQRNLKWMTKLIVEEGITDWNDFTPSNKTLIENTSLLVGLLYNMCKVNLVISSENKDDVNKINSTEIEDAMNDADSFLNEHYSV